MTKHISWSLVDLTRPAAELAEELGCNVLAVYRARQRLGIVVPKISGGARPGAGGPRFGNQNRKGKTLPDSMTQYQLRIPPALLDAIKKEAKRTHTTASEVIRLAIVAHLHRIQHGATEETQISQ